MLSVRRPTKTGSVTIGSVTIRSVTTRSVTTSFKNVIYHLNFGFRSNFAFRRSHSGQLNKRIFRKILILLKFTFICFGFAILKTLNFLVCSLVNLC